MKYKKLLLLVLMCLFTITLSLSQYQVQAASVYEETINPGNFSSTSSVTLSDCTHYNKFVYNGYTYSKQKMYTTGTEYCSTDKSNRNVYSVIYLATPQIVKYNTTYVVDRGEKISISVGSQSEISYDTSVSANAKVSAGVSCSVGSTLTAGGVESIFEETEFEFEVDAASIGDEYAIYIEYYITQIIELTYVPKVTKTWSWTSFKYNYVLSYSLDTTSVELTTVISDVQVSLEEV